MKKALVNASVASMISLFSMNNIDVLQSLGYQVDVACNFDPAITPLSEERIAECKAQLKKRHIRILNTACPRSITSVVNMQKTYKQLSLIAEREKYDLVHTMSPIGGVICRLAFRNARHKFGTHVIYQAHGFHFYHGAPRINWTIYYPIERWCSSFTDTLITITKEDYKRAKEEFYCRNVQYVPGIGLDTSRFKTDITDVEMAQLRETIGAPQDAFLLLSVGELNENKNHELVIKAIKKLNNENVYYCIAGEGEKRNELNNLINSLGLSRRVKLLGFRTDVPNLYKISNAFVLPSKREGLNVSIMEAMASGKPCLVSRIRGNVDLVNNAGGELFDPYSVEDCTKAINRMIKLDEKELAQLGNYNSVKVRDFEDTTVIKRITDIYKKIGV